MHSDLLEKLGYLQEKSEELEMENLHIESQWTIFLDDILNSTVINRNYKMISKKIKYLYNLLFEHERRSNQGK